MKRLSQWLAFPLALLVLVGVIFYNRHLIADQINRPLPEIEHHDKRPDVTVVKVNPRSYSANLTGYGQAVPRYELPLTAQVAGQVTSLGEHFATGALLHKGDILLRMDDVQYRASVAEAESELADAKLAYLEEERQGLQARTEWAASGLSGKPASELVLRKPQLAAADAAVKNKEAALASARSNLAKTIITAPFDCIVISREVTPGSYLQSGSEIATIYSSDTMEIAISLSAKDWHNLPAQSEFGKWPVAITSVETDDAWTGTISRLEQHLDTETRQRTVIITVPDPLILSPPLLANTFVAVSFPGRATGNLLQLPGSALSQRGEIWYVTSDKALDRFSAEPLFSDSEFIYVEAPAIFEKEDQLVLTHPLSSYLVGMAVNPVAEESNEH